MTSITTSGRKLARKNRRNAASDGFGWHSREWLKRESPNFTYLSETIGPTKLWDMTSLAFPVSWKMQLKYVSLQENRIWRHQLLFLDDRKKRPKMTIEHNKCSRRSPLWRWPCYYIYRTSMVATQCMRSIHIIGFRVLLIFRVIQQRPIGLQLLAHPQLIILHNKKTQFSVYYRSP